MGDLVLLLNQVQLLLDNRVILVFVLAHLEQDLDHVLRTAVDVGLVQDVAELVENGVGNRRGHLLQKQANLAHESNGNLDAVVGWLLKQQKQDLSRQHLVHYLVVHQMGYKHGRRQTHGLVVPLECLSESHDQPLNQQLAHLGQFCVADGSQAGIDRSKG
jgi:hypothetical protein